MIAAIKNNSRVFVQLCLMFLAMPIHAALPHPILQYDFDESVAATSYPCGEPGYNANTEKLLLIWEDCPTGNWYLRVTAGGDSAQYTGSLISNQAFSSVRGVSLEKHDTLNTTNPNRIDFAFKTWESAQDGINFSFPQNAEVTLELTSSSDVRIGKNLESINPPFTISGETAPSTAATNIIIDSSQHNLHAVLSQSDNHNMPVPVAGHSGSAMYFDSSALINVGDHNKLDLEEFTISAWINYQRYPGDTRQEIMEKADSYWMNIRQDTQRIRVGGIFGACKGTSRKWIYVDSISPLSENTWSHVVASYNGSFLRSYINGRLEGQVIASGPLCDNDQPLIIGAKYLLQTLDSDERELNPPVAHFNGSIDSVRIYDRALTDIEIQEVMNK